LSAAAVANLRAEYARSIRPARDVPAEALKLENQLCDLVNKAYGLTPEKSPCSGKPRRHGCP